MAAFWDELTGQADAIAIVEAAASASAVGGSDDSSMTHSWLITGPPGSGRSNLAYAFAAALISQPGDEEATEAQVAARTHPDLGVLATERVIIAIKEVRDLVRASQFSPAQVCAGNPMVHLQTLATTKSFTFPAYGATHAHS